MSDVSAYHVLVCALFPFPSLAYYCSPPSVPRYQTFNIIRYHASSLQQADRILF